MMEATRKETREVVTLDEILPVIHRLIPIEKIALIRILADDLAKETKTLFNIPPGVYEFYTPYEIEGLSDDMVRRFESLPQPILQDAN